MSVIQHILETFSKVKDNLTCHVYVRDCLKDLHSSKVEVKCTPQQSSGSACVSCLPLSMQT